MNYYNMKKSIILAILTLSFFSAFAQNQDYIYRNNQLTGTSTDVARVKIILGDGFSTQGTSGTSYNYKAYIDKNLPYSNSYDYNINYVHSFTPLADTEVIEKPSTGDDNWLESYQFYDGLGRPIQTNVLNASPFRSLSIVQTYEYDEFGRQTTQYMPYTATGEAGFRSLSIVQTEQENFYSTLFSGQGESAKSETLYNNSPLNIPVIQSSAGDDWQMDAGHVSEVSMGRNTSADNVIIWSVSSDGHTLKRGNYYGDNLLYKTKVTDPDEKQAVVYKDKSGRAILKVNLLTSDESSADNPKTYYVYDKYGRTSFVIPPKAVAQLTGSQYHKSRNLIKELCYFYQYNDKHLLVEKQLPGKAFVTIEYDNLDRPIRSQDGNQREISQSSYITYDIFGRLEETGVSNEQTGSQNPEFYIYYDSYEFIDDPANNFGTRYNFRPTTANPTNDDKVKGMTTITKTKVLGEIEANTDDLQWLRS